MKKKRNFQKPFKVVKKKSVWKKKVEKKTNISKKIFT